jgi:hypothetical protein
MEHDFTNFPEITQSSLEMLINDVSEYHRLPSGFVFKPIIEDEYGVLPVEYLMIDDNGTLWSITPSDEEFEYWNQVVFEGHSPDEIRQLGMALMKEVLG